jgi:Fic family protein
MWKLSASITQRLHEDLRIRLTYHSNAIEGNTLTLRETQIVIEEGVTIGGHSLTRTSGGDEPRRGF